MVDPHVDVSDNLIAVLVFIGLHLGMEIGTELELPQRGAVAGEEQTVDEGVEVRRRGPPTVVGDAQGGHRLPEVAPEAGEHGRAHRLMWGQKVEHVLKDPFREAAEEVRAAVHRGVRVEPPVLAARRHSVEQAVGAGAAEGEANEMPENSTEMEGI